MAGMDDMKKLNDDECEICHHYPWSSKIFKDSASDGWGNFDVEYECECKCHDAKFEKKRLYVSVTENEFSNSSSDSRPNKILTKKQWEKFKKTNSKTGKWKEDKEGVIRSVLDESLAYEAAKREGILGYKDEGDTSRYPEEFTGIDGTRLSSEWLRVRDGRPIYYVEAVKLVVCPMCKKSDFDDAVYERMIYEGSWDGRRHTVQTNRRFAVSGDTEKIKACVAKHEHQFIGCICGRLICAVAFEDYFGHRHPSLDSRYAYDEYSTMRDIEKIWGITEQSDPLTKNLIDVFKRFNLPIRIDSKDLLYGGRDPVYYLNFLDVFKLKAKDDGTVDGEKLGR